MVDEDTLVSILNNGIRAKRTGDFKSAIAYYRQAIQQ